VSGLFGELVHIDMCHKQSLPNVHPVFHRDRRREKYWLRTPLILSNFTSHLGREGAMSHSSSIRAATAPPTVARRSENCALACNLCTSFIICPELFHTYLLGGKLSRLPVAHDIRCPSLPMGFLVCSSLGCEGEFFVSCGDRSKSH
jgi:hypothetical protein